MSDFCRCPIPEETTVEGVRTCSTCGDPLPDQRQGARDKLLLLIARQQQQALDQQAEILERLDALEGSGSAPAPAGLLDAAQTGKRFGVSARWARDHADELGAIRLGSGPRAPLRFDPEEVATRLAARSEGRATSKPKTKRRRRARTKSDGLLEIKGRAPA